MSDFIFMLIVVQKQQDFNVEAGFAAPLLARTPRPSRVMRVQMRCWLPGHLLSLQIVVRSVPAARELRAEREGLLGLFWQSPRNPMP